MKQVMVCLFAHPDDETFGPSGTVAKLCAEGWDVHVITLTSGESGVNTAEHTDLGAIRLQELRDAAHELGCVSVTPLGFPDGGLSHSLYPAMKAAVMHELDEVLSRYDEPIVLSLMSFEDHGLTGHLDHIAAHFLTQNVFWQLDGQPPANVTVRAIWYFCLPTSTVRNTRWTDFYQMMGRSDRYITDRIDVSPWLEKKYSAMDKHVSQKDDAAQMKALGDEKLGVECFRIIPATARES